ncbi:TonB-dependent receptor domain-containing protein, partial [Salmonella enterica]
FVIDDDEATFGNPDLKPLESSNLDLGIEHFMGRAGTVSAFVFYKDIKHFVYNTDVAGTGAWTNFAEAHTYANGDSAKLYG